jgi:hypothetical protein
VFLAVPLEDGQLPRAATLNPYVLGASATDVGHAGSYGRRDPYVARTAQSVDSRIRTALESGHFVLIVGASKVGKTRTAFEAVRDRWSQSRVVAPSLQAPLRRLAMWPPVRDGDDPLVLFLDDLHGYIASADPLRSSTLDLFFSRPGGVVAVATLRYEELQRLEEGAGELTKDVRALLDRARPYRVDLASTADDPDEQAAAQASYPDENLSRYGLGEQLTGGPALLEHYRRSSTDEVPAEYYVVRSAVDWARFPIGARLRILPNHACATAAQHGEYLVVLASRAIVARWPRFAGW